MGLTNFPNGVSSFGIPLLGSGPVFTTGSVRFVSSGIGTDSNTGLDPDRPKATIDSAINASTATATGSPGEDYIIVQPLHAETHATTGALNTMDVNGVQVLGLGSGPNRPTITMNTEAAGTAFDWTSAGDGTSLSNILFVAGVDSLASMIDFTSDPDGVHFESLEFRDVVSSIGILDTVIINAGINVRFQNCRFDETDTGVSQSAILGTTPDSLIIDGCFIDKDAVTGLVELGVATQVLIQNNYMEQNGAEDECIVIAATGTGWINNNYFRLTDDAANITEAVSDGAGGTTLDVQLGRNWVVNSNGERALEHNAVQSQDSA